MHIDEIPAAIRSAQRILGQNARRLREGAGLTQEQAATKMGCPRQTVAKIEAGEVNVTLRTLARMSRALKVDVTELIARRKNPTDPR